MKPLLCVSALLASTTFLWANPSALLIANEDYSNLGSVRYGDPILGAERDLRRAGMVVEAFDDLSTVPLLTELNTWVQAAPKDELLVIALSGRFVNDGTQSWFLGTDARDPRLFSVAGMGVSVSSVLRVLADHPGQALLVLGDEGDDDRVGTYLSEGLGPIDPPQGVTVLSGVPFAVADSLQAFARSGGNVSDAVNAGRNVELSGFAPRVLSFGDQDGGSVAIQTPTQPTQPAANEQSEWARAKTQDTIFAYETYLNQFPNGANADRSKAMIKEIQTEPNRAARLEEEGLGLSRDARREIQRDLSVLGYNTRGIDGIFGRGSWAAVGNWQAASGMAKTGYLTADQIGRLDGQATRRVAELEAEAERKREIAARQDRAFWQETGAAGDETGYRAYLTKYPDGDFAETATAELDKIEAAKRRQAAGRDKQAWDQVSQQDTPDAYRAYLDQFPQGAFRGEAEAKLQEFQQDAADADGRAKARATEERLGLTPSMARLVELRLAQLGLKPGTVDGTFDRSTRRAIRRYQQDRNLNVTGFMGQATAVRMLSGGFQIKLK